MVYMVLCRNTFVVWQECCINTISSGLYRAWYVSRVRALVSTRSSLPAERRMEDHFKAFFLQFGPFRIHSDGKGCNMFSPT